MYKHNEYLFNFILMDNHIMISDYFSVFFIGHTPMYAYKKNHPFLRFKGNNC